jgi:arylsulfatase A-like enzyme
LGEHGGWCKHTNFELDARAPLIIRAPGQKAPGGKSSALVEFVDIYPTLCDLAGIEKPSHLEGQSAAFLLNDPQAAGDPTALSQYPRGRIMGYSMRTDRYRLTVWQHRETGDIDAIELYDHLEDPAENVNVASVPANRALVERLQQQLKKEFTRAPAP